MNYQRVISALRESARTLLPAEEADDAVQEAMTSALAAAPASEEELLETARAHLGKQRTRAYWATRRSRSVPLDEAGSEATTSPAPRRRVQSRGLRRPKGVTGANLLSLGPQLLKNTTGNVPSPDVQLAAHRLAAKDLSRVGYGEPCSRKAEKLILALYAEFYGTPFPQHHWATVLLDEIEDAKLQELRASEAGMHDPPPPGASATMVRKKPEPGEAKQFDVTMDVELVPAGPNRAVQYLFATVDGERKCIATVPGSFDDEFTYPLDPIERSAIILQKVRLELSSMEVPQPLPAFADDEALVRWLFIRTGFQGGGGPDAVTRATLLDWLQEPAKLVHQILAYAERRAEHGTDAQADRVQTELRGLAERVRTHGVKDRGSRTSLF